jgi:hypothetical protein
MRKILFSFFISVSKKKVGREGLMIDDKCKRKKCEKLKAKVQRRK